MLVLFSVVAAIISVVGANNCLALNQAHRPNNEIRIVEQPVVAGNLYDGVCSCLRDYPGNVDFMSCPSSAPFIKSVVFASIREMLVLVMLVTLITVGIGDNHCLVLAPHSIGTRCPRVKDIDNICNCVNTMSSSDTVRFLVCPESHPFIGTVRTQECTTGNKKHILTGVDCMDMSGQKPNCNAEGPA
ncbi:hypothetical protein ACHWQZ_G013797 [Mnemiopsis leidyi]